MSDQLKSVIPTYPQKIGYELLVRRGACISQLALFSFYFPDGFVVNAENIALASTVGLDLNWAVKIFLPVYEQEIKKLVTHVDPNLSSRRAFAKALTDFLRLSQED